MNGKHNKLFLIGVCLICIIGIIVTALLQIMSLNAHVAEIEKIPFVGYIFSYMYSWCVMVNIQAKARS